MAGSAASGFEVLTSEGQTCASAGLAAITSAAECQQVITAVNAADGKRRSGSVSTVDYSFKPSGCYAACQSSRSGFFCSEYNTATTTRSVGSSAKGIFCKASLSTSGMCYGRTCSQIARVLNGPCRALCPRLQLQAIRLDHLFSSTSKAAST